MCGPQVLAFMGAGGGAAAGAGATAASGLGTALAVGGSLVQGVMGLQQGRAQQKQLQQQADTEARLSAVQDQRTRQKFLSQISAQRAQLAARGFNLNSPTALALGQEAAQEMSFDSQAVRSGGNARVAQLSAEGRAARYQGVSSFLRGAFSAAGTMLNTPQELWPGFDRNGERVPE